jgi:hypothetical protein
MRHSSRTRNRATPGSSHLLGAKRLRCFEAVDYPFRLLAFEEMTIVSAENLVVVAPVP